VLETQAEVVGVCTLETSPFNADHHDLRALCETHGVEWAYTPDVNSEASVDWIRARRPDVIFCFGWSRILRRPLLESAPLGIVGFHPAALPANRGRHPLIWALALGLEQTASTFFFMDERADGGDLLSQRAIAIDAADDAAALYEKVTRCALDQIREFVPRLAAGDFVRVPQDDSAANTWRKRGRADGQIDWRMSARTIHNLVRALAKPYVGAHFRHQDSDIKVWRTEIVTGTPSNIEPGKVFEISHGGPVVACGADAIRLTQLEPAVQLVPGEYL
jgi:methionyl-tRNA formyltransferase